MGTPYKKKFVNNKIKGIDMKKITSVISLLFIVLFIFVGNVYSSSDWVEYKTDKDGDVYFYKKVNVEKKDGNHLIQVWDKIVFSDEGREKYIQILKKIGSSTEGRDKLSYSMTLKEIDCKKERSRDLSISQYDMDGHKIYQGNFDKPEWNYIVPDSIGESFMKKICK